MNEIQQLRQRINKLESIINEFYRSDRYYFRRNISLGESVTITASNKNEDGPGVRFKGKYTFFDGEYPVGAQGPLSSDPAFTTLGGTYSQSDLNTNFGKIVSWNDDLVAGLYKLGLFHNNP